MIELAGLPLLALAAFTAWRLARLRPYYRPIGRLLAANLAADIAGLAIFQLYVHAFQVPYTGVARLAFHVEQATGLVWPVGVAAVALVVLARRSPWPAFVAGGVAVVVRGALYPWLRQERLAWLLLGEQVALVGLCAWAAIQLPKHTQTVERSPAPLLLEHHKAALWIAGLEVALLAGPHLLRQVNGFATLPFEKWWIAQVGYSALFIWLSILQWRWVCRARRLIS